MKFERNIFVSCRIYRQCVRNAEAEKEKKKKTLTHTNENNQTM